MEENIHDDKLDDYVRKSFEGHEEDPSPDMWSRVEGDLLPHAAVPTPRAIYLRYGWQALAATAILILFSMLVCEHLYYEEKLRALTENPVKEFESKDNANGQAIQEIPNPPLPTQSSRQLNTGTTGSGAPNSTNQQGPAALPGVQEVAEGSSTIQDLEKSEATAGNLFYPRPENAVAINTRNENDKKDLFPSFIGTEKSEAPLLQPIVESNALNQNIPKPIDITHVPILPYVLECPNPILPSLAKISIEPVRETSGWYVGLQTSLFTNIEKTRTLNPRPGRLAFNSKQKNEGSTTIWWLKTGKKLSEQFSLESGIGYQNTTRTATHTPRFRFGDGSIQGPSSTKRIFHYDLSTQEGTAEVSLRMEVTNGSPVSDNEPVTLSITTSERTEMLRIPLLAAYRFGGGRFQGQLKAGLLGNFVVKNELDISARVSQNARFQPVSGKDGYTVRLNRPKFFLGYWLSAGAEFRLNRHISVLAESALVGDFPRNDQYDRRLPERFLFGLNVGANYYF
ncbi:MAG: hypothetical protein ACKVU0_10155 [Saprospiraceae bacterium]